MQKSSGFSLVEMIVVAAAAGVLVAAVLPPLSRSRAQALRRRCATNLRLALHGMRLYAEEHAGQYPSCGFGLRTKRFDIVGWKLTARCSLVHSNSRNLFLPVRMGFITPAALLCPETPDRPAALGPPGRPFHDFNVGHGDDFVNRFSYSYHLQFGRRDARTPGYPLTSASHPSMAVLADRTPCVRYTGLAYGSGTYSMDVGLPPGRPAHRANSLNHAGRGQNVAFVDGRVQWAPTPTVGPHGDNIYTVWAPGDRSGGAISHGSMPRGPTDSFLVP